MTVELLMEDWTHHYLNSGGAPIYLKPGDRVLEVKVQYDDGEKVIFSAKTRVEKVIRRVSEESDAAKR